MASILKITCPNYHTLVAVAFDAPMTQEDARQEAQLELDRALAAGHVRAECGICAQRQRRVFREDRAAWNIAEARSWAAEIVQRQRTALKEADKLREAMSKRKVDTIPPINDR